MIDGGVVKNTYVETTVTTLKKLLQFHDFLYRHIRNYKRYKQ